MEPFTNEEITALLCDAMPAARNLAESKAAESAAKIEANKAATLAAFPDSIPVTDEILTAPAGSGE